MLSVKISRSVRPVYLNFVPHEKKPPPDTTAACWLFGKLYQLDKNSIKNYNRDAILERTYVKNNICSMAHRHKYRQLVLDEHLNPIVCFFCGSKLFNIN